MGKAEILKKAGQGEGLTVKEIIVYQKAVEPKIHTYGKYGCLAKEYLEQHNIAKLILLGGDLPNYLHDIDSQAADMSDTMRENLLRCKKFQKTGEYIHDLRIETELQGLIEQEILSELVYMEANANE